MKFYPLLLLFNIPVLQALLVTDNPIELRTVEEQVVMTSIGKVPNEFLSMINGGTTEYLTFENKFFNVTPSGDVIITKSIDLDTICSTHALCCDNKVPCVISSKISTKPGKVFHLNVEIEDINDNKPICDSTQHFHVYERSPDSISIKDSAKDSDYDVKNNVLNFMLNEDDIANYFNQRRLGSHELFPKSEKIDYEKVKHISGSVKVCDLDQNHCVECSLTIEVNNVNDNWPKFSQDSYNITIPEDQNLDKPLLKLEATDLDGDRIYYWINKTLTPEKSFNKFSLSDTAEIYTKSPLKLFNKNAPTTYELHVSAGETQFRNASTTTKIIINIQDVNDHAPEITKVDVKTNIEENQNSELKTPLFTFSVSDKDMDDNGRVNCSLVRNAVSSGNVLQMLLTSPNFYVVKVDPKSKIYDFDAENKEIVNLLSNIKVICEDYGKPSLRTEATWSIKINDVNEFPPSLTSKSYLVEVPENSPFKTFVTKIEATDRDREPIIRYKISSNEHFNIDEKTGEIFVNSHLDREQTPQIVVYVSVHDEGSDNPSAPQVEVRITLTDVNDNNPQFLSFDGHGPISFSILENKDGTASGNFRVVDPDSGVNGTVDVKLIGAWIQKDEISVKKHLKEQRAGDLWSLNVLKPFDREMNNNIRTEDLFITLAFEACDRSPIKNDQRCTYENFTLVVLDDNDFAPEWIYPGISERTVNITENKSIGEQIMVLRARDRDSNKNAELLFSLNDPRGNVPFEVEPETGILRIRKDLEGGAIKTGTYRLGLIVKDKGIEPKSSPIVLTINVNKSNENSYLYLILILVIALVTCLIVVSLVCVIYCMKKKSKAKSCQIRNCNNGLLNTTDGKIDTRMTNGSSRFQPPPGSCGYIYGIHNASQLPITCSSGPGSLSQDQGLIYGSMSATGTSTLGHVYNTHLENGQQILVPADQLHQNSYGEIIYIPSSMAMGHDEQMTSLLRSNPSTSIQQGSTIRWLAANQLHMVGEPGTINPSGNDNHSGTYLVHQQPGTIDQMPMLATNSPSLSGADRHTDSIELRTFGVTQSSRSGQNSYMHPNVNEEIFRQIQSSNATVDQISLIGPYPTTIQNTYPGTPGHQHVVGFTPSGQPIFVNEQDRDSADSGRGASEDDVHNNGLQQHTSCPTYATVKMRAQGQVPSIIEAVGPRNQVYPALSKQRSTVMNDGVIDYCIFPFDPVPEHEQAQFPPPPEVVTMPTNVERLFPMPMMQNTSNNGNSVNLNPKTDT